MIIEPPPFRSVEEAQEFLRNHEIATNNKYVTGLVRNFSTAGITTMKYPKIRWTYELSNGEYFDGIPFAIIGIKKQDCQYGTNYNATKRKAQEKYRPRKTDKTRETAPSKKVNCPAKAKMTLIVKFPEYAVQDNIKFHRVQMGQKMKKEFSDDTQRYVLVYLRINFSHEHGADSLLLNNLPRRITAAHIQSTSMVVLKSGASLIGKNMTGVISQFACLSELPDCLAQPSVNQSLKMMEVEELLALYWDITGETPNNVFTEAQKEFSENGLRLLLHLCIVFANVESESDGRIMAHHSIRIAGTENDIDPIPCCIDTNCVIEDPHMHCPLCTKHKAFTDPSMLRKHYNIKHVKTAIDCAGLKILRCRDECILKGFIKDVKAYTHGHWHCWKCDMGYEKREATLSHFQSHLNNCESGSVLVSKTAYPATNSDVVPYNINQSKTQIFSSKEVASRPKLNKSLTPDNKFQDVYIPTGSYTDKSLVDTDFVYTEPAAEEIQTSEYEQAVLYIQDEDEQVVYGQANENTEEVVIQIPEPNDTVHLHEKVEELQQRCMLLERNNLAQKSHIEFLTHKIDDLTAKQSTICSNCSKKLNSDIPFESSSHTSKALTSTSGKTNLSTCNKAVNCRTSNVKETQASLLKSLDELRSLHKNKNQVITDPVHEITEGILELKKEIETLKMTSGIGNLNKSRLSTIGEINSASEINVQSSISLENDKKNNNDNELSCVAADSTTSDNYEDSGELDYTMFGKSSERNKGRRNVILPLPENAIDVLKKCRSVDHSNQSTDLKETVYTKEKPIVTKIYRCWEVDDNEKLTQTDFDESFGVQYDENKSTPSIVLTKPVHKLYTAVKRTNDTSDNGSKLRSLDQKSESTPLCSPTDMNKPVCVTRQVHSISSESGEKIMVNCSDGDRLNLKPNNSSNLITLNHSTDKKSCTDETKQGVIVTLKPGVNKIMNSNKAISVRVIKISPGGEGLSKNYSGEPNSLIKVSSESGASPDKTIDTVKTTTSNVIKAERSCLDTFMKLSGTSPDERMKLDGTSPVKSMKSDGTSLDSTLELFRTSPDRSVNLDRISSDEVFKSGRTSPDKISKSVLFDAIKSKTNSIETNMASRPCIVQLSPSVIQTRGVMKKRQSNTHQGKTDISVTAAKKKKVS